MNIFGLAFILYVLKWSDGRGYMNIFGLAFILYVLKWSDGGGF